MVFIDIRQICNLLRIDDYRIKQNYLQILKLILEIKKTVKRKTIDWIKEESPFNKQIAT